ncbi:MAG: hypothetical protein M3N51_06235 [Actinomycetota bacterium]|nr:hypothetical protein [Actinomycetota bacterium]
MSAHPDARSGHPHPPAPWLIFSITLTGIVANPLISPAIPDILAGLGASAGLLIGALTDLFGWQAPFLVYPLALLTAWLLGRRLPRSLSRGLSASEQLSEAIPVLRSPAAGP